MSDVEDQGQYECVANNTVGTEYSKSTQLYVKGKVDCASRGGKSTPCKSSSHCLSACVSVRRVTPSFSIPPPPVSQVTLGESLNLTCVAVGAPMPYVKWRKEPAIDMTPDDKLPIGRNVLMLTDIQESANYTCIAASDLGVIETVAMVKVQCEFDHHGLSVSLIVFASAQGKICLVKKQSRF